MLPKLSDDLFCVDSLPGFREVLVNNCHSHQNDTILSGIKPLSSNSKATSLVPKCGWSNEDYDYEMMQAAEFAEHLTQKTNVFNVEELEIQIKLQMERARKNNESTPVRTRKSITAEPPKESGAKRKILRDKEEPKIKYNLKSLYESLTNKKLIDAHRAEADALALLECVTAVGLPILQWMDCNRIPFKSIKRKW